MAQAITALAALQLPDGPLSELVSPIPTGRTTLDRFARAQEVLLEAGPPERCSRATPDSTVQCLESQRETKMRSISEVDTTITFYVGKAALGWPDSHVINLGDVAFSGKALLVAIVILLAAEIQLFYKFFSAGPTFCKGRSMFRSLDLPVAT